MAFGDTNLGQAFGAMSPLAGGLLGHDQLQRPTTALDPGTEAIIQGQQNRASQSNEDFAKERMAGMDQSGAIKQGQEDQALKNQAMGGLGGPEASAALNNRQNKMYAQDFNTMQQKQQLENPALRFQQQHAAFQGLMDRATVQSGIVSRKRDQIMQEKMARDQAINSIFGGIGKGAGMIAGMPPTASAPQQNNNMTDESLNQDQMSSRQRMRGF